MCQRTGFNLPVYFDPGPPIDDIPGRLIGMELGPKAFLHARDYFDGRL